MDLDEVAAELYGLPLGEFVGARNARSKQAKADGDRDLAAAITALAKPSKVGWLTNQLVRERWADIEPLLALGAGLREATATLSGDDLRRLTRQQHQLVHALVQQAKSVAAGLGERVTDDVADGVEQTLRAALADEALAEQLAGGQLTDRLEYAGFGGGGVAGEPSSPARLRSVPTGPGSAGARPGGAGAATGRNVSSKQGPDRESADRVAQAKREAAELARREAAAKAAAALAEATQAAATADEAQAAAEAALDDAVIETRTRAERVEALRAEVEAAVVDHAAARQAEQQARTRLTEAERAARTAARRVGAATTERDRWAPT